MNSEVDYGMELNRLKNEDHDLKRHLAINQEQQARIENYLWSQKV